MELTFRFAFKIAPDQRNASWVRKNREIHTFVRRRRSSCRRDRPRWRSDIRSLAARTVFGAHSRRAFLIGASPAFDLARLYATQRDAGGETNVRTVANLEAAAEWTGVDLDAAKRALAELTRRLESSA